MEVPPEGTRHAGSEGSRRHRVLVVAHYASEQTGGAGSIPLRLFGRLRAHGVDARLLTHESGRAELAELLPPAEFERVSFARGLPGLQLVSAAGRRLPGGLRTVCWAITQLERQIAMVPATRRLVRELGIEVVHQPISVSPVTPSPLAGVGAPIVMGPLNGGMALPRAFRSRDSLPRRLMKDARPVVAAALNRIVRGRLHADAVLVANDRTRSFLPKPVRSRAIEASDIGVVLEAWPSSPPREPDGVTRFLFVGRLVDWKGVDVLLDAFSVVGDKIPAKLEIVGDGRERAVLAAQAERLGCAADVTFTGWLSPQECADRMRRCDVFVSSSLQESGGIAVLEAMACSRPVIATAWGGHLGTVDDTVGVLVGVASRADTVHGLADAMVELANDPALRARLGAAGRHRIETCYDWNVLVDDTLRLYDEVCGQQRADRCVGHPAQNSPAAR